MATCLISPANVFSTFQHFASSWTPPAFPTERPFVPVFDRPAAPAAMGGVNPGALPASPRFRCASLSACAHASRAA
eukprot:2269982-Pleurochrysis_carterae.AAC.1